MDDFRILFVSRDERASREAISLLGSPGTSIEVIGHGTDARDRITASAVPIRFAYLADESDGDGSMASRIAAQIRSHSPGCYVLIAPPSGATQGAGASDAVDPLDPRIAEALRAMQSPVRAAPLTGVVRDVMGTLMQSGGLRRGTRVVEVLLLALLGEV